MNKEMCVIPWTQGLSFLRMHKVKVGFTCGAFDLLHAGHALMLAEAREQCDHLIVAVQSDPSLDRSEKNAPVQSYEERLIMVKAIKWVDEVICYDTEKDLYGLLIDIAPDIRIVGADWEGKDFTGHDLDIVWNKTAACAVPVIYL